LDALSSFKVENKDGYVIENGGTLIFEGVYTITAIDNFGNVLVLNIEIRRTPPSIILTGVENGGTTGDSVTVNFENAVTRFLVTHRNETIRAINNGDTFTEHGTYRIRAVDLAGNESFVNFQIRTRIDFTTSVINGSISSSSVSFVFIDDVTVRVYFNGEISELRENYSDTGHYRVVAHDEFGNDVDFEFTIVMARAREMIVPNTGTFQLLNASRDGEHVQIESGDAGIHLVENGRHVLTFMNLMTQEIFELEVEIDNVPPTVDVVRNGNGFVVQNPSKRNVTYTMTRNGNATSFRLGQQITTNGRYVLVVKDDLGNYSVHEFTVNFKWNWAATTLFTIIGIAVAVIIYAVVRGARRAKVA
jgi:hypothetical protein